MAEYKAAEEERHKVAVQLSTQKNKVNNHKIKYEALIQKNKPSGDGESDSTQEHSQAYYVIKAAQEREEL
jgi:UDP-glucose:O-linked fucose beta-1,3-glucosyltransferase